MKCNMDEMAYHSMPVPSKGSVNREVKERKGISSTLSEIRIHDLIFSPPTSRTGYRKPRSARFDDEFLQSRPRYACQPIDIAWGNYLLNRLQNFKSLAYHTLADCRPFHPVQAECFQGTGVCLNCSTHTSTPRSDEAFESHATGLDQT